MNRLMTVLLTASLLFAPVMLQATEPPLGTLCYCTSGSGCINNTCSLIEYAMCHVDFNTSNWRLRHLCGGIFTACGSTTGVKEVCCNEPLCNKCLLPPDLTYQECLNVTLPDGCPVKNCTEPTGATSLPTKQPALEPWAIAVTALVIIVAVGIAALVFIVVCVLHKRKRKEQVPFLGANPTPSELGSCTTDTITGLSSGGFTDPSRGRALETRTMIKDIRFIECIASGAYGEVWRASYHGEQRAVKKFTKIGDTSYRREYLIYQSGHLSHPNIVLIYGLDAVAHIYGGVELNLIMAYYELGCLADYLRDHTLTPRQVLKMLTSISSALDFLHTPVITFCDKFEGIAHRDLKTRNIMVQNENGNCVIGDFGLSLISQDLHPDQPPVSLTAGTKRYMAPELLNGTILARELSSFCAADVYSFGLIMWEVLRRGEIDGHVCEYKLPYHSVLPDNPSFEEVRKVVVDQRLRPELEERWKDNEVYYPSIVSLMRECWCASPDGRPMSTRIKMKLEGIVTANKLHT